MSRRNRIQPGKRRFHDRPRRRIDSPTRRSVYIERLESRRVLTGVSFNAGLLTVDGTGGNDSIVLSPTTDGLNVQVKLNGQVISNSNALNTITQIQVNGGDGNDVITVKSIDKPVNVDGGVDGGTGTNELSIIGHPSSNTFILDTSSVQVNGAAYLPTNVQLLTVNGQNANDNFIMNNLPAISTIIDGAGGVNSLQGRNADTTWNLLVSNGGTLGSSFHFGNIQNLTGGSKDDEFVFSAGKTINGTIDGGGGTGVDTVDFGNYTTPIILNLQSQSATGLGRFKNIETIDGGAAKDTIVGPNQSSTWNITGINSVVLQGLPINFTSFENLTGGNQSDTFHFDDGAFVMGRVDGGAGSNSMNFSAYMSLVTFNLQTSTFSSMGTGTFAHIQNVTGTANANTDLIGPNANTIWSITVGDRVTVSGIAFINIGSLTGGTKADTFLFEDETTITGTIDGREGTDLLKYSLYSSPITVDLTQSTATGAGTIANMEGVIGTSGSSDTLIGPDLGPGLGNTWTITANNVGNVNGFTFSGIDNLTGGPEDDTFVMTNGKVFTGNIDGGASTVSNTLDYSTYRTPVKVDLTVGTTTNITGHVTNISDVLGGTADDVLTGDGQDNLLRGNGGDDTIEGMDGNDILVGGAGNDKITGGSDDNTAPNNDGRDLLFGGAGKDALFGGAGEDILFAGTTSFDNNGTTQALLLTFWIRTDLNFATRVSELRAGTTGVTGMPTLNSTNVLADTSSDTLTGGHTNVTNAAGDDNLDWFFAKLSGPGQDTITDFSGGEQLN
jgi:Ca2+-binding RTX toxin-like protein